MRSCDHEFLQDMMSYIGDSKEVPFDFEIENFWTTPLTKIEE